MHKHSGVHIQFRINGVVVLGQPSNVMCWQTAEASLTFLLHETGNSDNQSFDTDRNRLLFLVDVNGNTKPFGKIITSGSDFFEDDWAPPFSSTRGQPAVSGVLFRRCARALIDGSSDNREIWRPSVSGRSRIAFSVLFRSLRRLYHLGFWSVW